MKPNSKSQAGTAADSSTKDDVTFVCQHNAKPNVVCSQSPTMTDEEIEVAKDFVWQHMTGYDKSLMIKMSSKEFVEQPDLRFYLTACVVKEGVTTDLQDSRQ